MPDKRPNHVDLTTADDSMLLAAFRNGNRKAFDVLWERHQKKLTRIITRIVQSSTDTEDVLQETGLSAVKSLGSDDEPIDDIFAFLAVIAIRRANEFLRKFIRNRRRYPVSLSLHHDVAVDSSRGDYYERVEHTKRVVLESLPAEDRMLVEQYYFESLTQKKLAQVHHRSRNRIGQRLKQIYSRSQEQLKIHFY